MKNGKECVRKNIGTLLEDSFCFLFYQERSGDRHSGGCSPPRELLCNVHRCMCKVMQVTRAGHVFIFAVIIPQLMVTDMVSKTIITIYIQGVTGGTDQTSGGCFLC